MPSAYLRKISEIETSVTHHFTSRRCHTFLSKLIILTQNFRGFSQINFNDNPLTKSGEEYIKKLLELRDLKNASDANIFFVGVCMYVPSKAFFFRTNTKFRFSLFSQAQQSTTFRAVFSKPRATKNDTTQRTRL